MYTQMHGNEIVMNEYIYRLSFLRSLSLVNNFADLTYLANPQGIPTATAK